MFKCARKCSLLLSAAVIFGGCAGTPPSARLSSSTTSPAKSADSEQTTEGLSDVFDEDRSQSMAITTTSEAVDLDRWPLTGLQDEGVGTWPVLMVKIDNHDRARPQAGISPKRRPEQCSFRCRLIPATFRQPAARRNGAEASLMRQSTGACSIVSSHIS